MKRKPVSVDRTGLGWRWEAKTKTLYLVFEVDDQGVKLAFRNVKVTPTGDQCDAAVLEVVEKGFEGIPAGKLKPITWEYYEYEYN